MIPPLGAFGRCLFPPRTTFTATTTLRRYASSFLFSRRAAAAATPTTAAPTTAWRLNPNPNPFGQHLLLFTRSFASKKHKRLLQHAKGYRGRSKNCFTIAIRRVEKAWQYAYRDRRRKKREWRKLWIVRLQAAVRQYQWRYSAFVPALAQANIQLNRKVLSELAATEPFAFKAIVDVVEQAQQQLVEQEQMAA